MSTSTPIGWRRKTFVRVCQRLRDDGVAGILATVITADVDAMCRRLANICCLRDADPAIRDMIWGIHIEGPFLNEEPGYIGAHPAAVRPAGRHRTR